MYSISNNYKNHIENDLSFSPKSKIVVDGIEYLGDVIKTTPVISHSNTKMIGGFPAKICKFEIYDFNNELDLVDKEIIVYRGLFIDGATEFIPQGIFIPKADNITTNISQRTISLDNVQDKTQLFDVKYESNLDWSTRHTGLEIIQEICDKLGVSLENENFNFSSYNFLQPNFSENTTCREVISRLAEIGGGIAFINRNGNLVIKQQTSTEHQIQRDRYNKLSKENPFIINTVVLGKDGIDDDIVFPYTMEEDRVEWKILDNPFVDLYREEMIEEVSQYIIGKSIIPFEMNEFIDGFYLDLNDTVSIIDKNGITFTGIILNYESTGRIKAKIGADVQSETQTNYNLAGSNKQKMRDVKLEVDHINRTVRALVVEVDEQGEKFTEIFQDIDNIVNSVQNTGGANLIQNSVMFAYPTEESKNNWDVSGNGTLDIHSSSEALNAGSASGHVFVLKDKLVKQRISVKADNDSIPDDEKTYYTFSTKIKKNIVGTCYVKISNAVEEYIIELGNGQESFYGDYEIKGLLPKTNYYDIEFYGSAESEATFTDNMFAIGTYKSQWQQASGEIMNTQVNVNLNGVLVKSSVYAGDYTVMSPLEFAGYSNINGTITKVFSLNKDTTLVKKLEAEDQIKMYPLKVVPITEGDIQGWAFVPTEKEAN